MSRTSSCSPAARGFGNDLNNVITGSSSSDTIEGGKGADSPFGNAGNDGISGGEGNDVIEGGLGIDSPEGGAGSDLFLYRLDNALDLNLLAGDTIAGFEEPARTRSTCWICSPISPSS